MIDRRIDLHRIRDWFAPLPWLIRCLIPVLTKESGCVALTEGSLVILMVMVWYWKAAGWLLEVNMAYRDVMLCIMHVPRYWRHSMYSVQELCLTRNRANLVLLSCLFGTHNCPHTFCTLCPEHYAFALHSMRCTFLNSILRNIRLSLFLLVCR